MRKAIYVILILASGIFRVSAQTDTSKVSRLDGMLDEYVSALESEPFETKFSECDFIIENCTDSLLRQRVALKLYGHYFESQLMGDEAVAIHIYDRWFADGTVRMTSEIDRMNAGVFAEYNRYSLLGMDAPVLILRDSSLAPVTAPASSGRQSVLYFYDVDCAKCKLESILLRYCLEGSELPLDFYAIYVGSNAADWKQYREEQLKICSTNVKTYHLWDPEAESEFHRMYGVLQTPRLFLVGSSGKILGRRLTVDALDQLLKAGEIETSLMSRNPVGARLPSITVPGELRKAQRSVQKTLSLDRFKGNPGIVMFYSETCSNCKAELAALEGGAAGKAKLFLVDVDKILADDPELAKSLFDNFDLSVLPHIISINRKGVITDRYISFAR